MELAISGAGVVDTEAARRTGGPGITTARPGTDSDALTSNG
jgi:hypothetical protein